MNEDVRRQIFALVIGVLFVILFIFSAQRLGKFIRERVAGTTAVSQNVSPTVSEVFVFDSTASAQPQASPTGAAGSTEKSKPPATASPSSRPASNVSRNNYVQIPRTGPENILLLIPMALTGFLLTRKFS